MDTIRRIHHISFINAFNGVMWAVKTQPNFRIHLTLAIISLILGIFLKINRVEMTVIIFTIVLGLSAELINTSIEAVTDLVTSQWHQQAKIAKDVAAGMMLTVAVGAALTGGIIFIPYIINIFN